MLKSSIPQDFGMIRIIGSVIILIGSKVYYWTDFKETSSPGKKKFELSGDRIIPKNHILFWKKETYSLQDIREVGFEKGFINDFRFSLKLITKDFRYAIYPIGTLSQKQWKRLEEDFKRHGIKVRYE